MDAPSQLQTGLLKGLSGFVGGYSHGYEKQQLADALKAKEDAELAAKREQTTLPGNVAAKLWASQIGADSPEEFNQPGARVPTGFADALLGYGSKKYSSDNSYETAQNKLNRGGGVRAKPGERYNEATDTFEPIPGSDLYLAQAGKHNKDLRSLNMIKGKSEMASTKIKEILADPNAIKSQFGGYGAFATQFTNPDAKNKIDSLKSNLMSAGLEIVKNGGGIGAISEAEWPIMEGMIAKLSPAMSEQEALHQLSLIDAKFANLSERTKEAYDLQWGNTPFTRPARTTRAGAGGGAPPPVDNARVSEIDQIIKGHRASQGAR